MDNTPETTNTEKPTAAESVATANTVCATELPPVTTEASAGVCTAGFDAPAEPFYKKYATRLSIAFAAIVILGAGGYVYATQYVHDGIIATVRGKDVYLYPQGGVIATVNGQKIYRKELNESVNLLSQSATAQGADISDPATLAEIRTQALEVLISNTLITAAAEEEGITVSAEDIQKQYDELLAQFGTQEEFTAKMTEVGLTEEKLRANISDRVLADRYVEAVTDIETVTVTDEEIAEFVKTISANGAKIPPLEEIRPQIEAQLIGQKQQEIVTALLEKLRTGATIEMKYSL